MWSGERLREKIDVSFISSVGMGLDGMGQIGLGIVGLGWMGEGLTS